MIKLPQNLKKYRAEKRVSQQDMAKEFNCFQGTISNWESGKCEPCISDLIKLSNYFDVTIDDLIGMDSWRHPKKDPPKGWGYYLVKIKEPKGRKEVSREVYDGSKFLCSPVVGWMPLPR